jgi:hypothetical protein
MTVEVCVPIGLAVLALFVVGAFLAHRAAKRRRQALAALARQWGVGFVADADHRPDERFPDLEFFAQGDERWRCNTISGPTRLCGVDVVVHAGDFTYEEHGRDSDGDRTTSTYHRSYFAVDLCLPTPALSVREEGFSDKVKALFGFSDIEFESAAFNRRFHVRCSDKKFAYDVFHPRAQEWLMAAPWRAFELAGGVLLVAGDEQWKVERFPQARAFAEAVLRQWPDFVWADLRAKAGIES